MDLPLTPQWARHAFLEPTFRRLMDEGYRANGAVFACMSVLAFSFPEPEMRIYEKTHTGHVPLEGHPAGTLLAKPNPQMSGAELWLYAILYMSGGGNCYIYKVRSKAGQVVELWPLNDAQIAVAPGKDKLVDHYEFFNAETGKMQPIDATDIIHLKWPAIDPIKPWKALAPLLAVARETDTDNEATNYLYSLLKNDAVPRIALNLPPGPPLSKDDKDELRDQWYAKQGGARRGGAALIPPGITIEKVALDMAEMAFEALRRVPEARIAAAFRVPAALAGLNVGLEQMTYSNLDGLQTFFTERTLVPLWRSVADEVTADLVREFDEDESVIAAFDTSQVIALAKNVDAKWTRANMGVMSGWITVNEGRAQVGLPRDPRGDVYLRNMGQITEDATSGEKRVAVARANYQSKDRDRDFGEFRKARTKDAALRAQKTARALNQHRLKLATKMSTRLDGYFDDLAGRVAQRAQKGMSPIGGAEVKAISANDLLSDEDGAELERIIREFVQELMSASWSVVSIALSDDQLFSASNPIVAKILERAGKKVKDISETTLAALQQVLKYGYENGWSVEQMVAGDGTEPGIRAVVAETYKNRARAIARTELGEAQNLAVADRMDENGFGEVMVFDGGSEDSDEDCNRLNGQIKTVAWARTHLLGHPNCVRTIAPYFEM
jgi:HK97 family phage portal protein